MSGVYLGSDSARLYLGDIPISTGEAVLTTKTITTNGTYAASSDNADGYSSVTVNVPAQMVTPNYVVDANVPYGGYGQKVIANLLIQDETALNSRMTSWDRKYSTYYEYEDQIGAYGGYTWATPITYSSVKLWVGRYEYQNKTLTITVQTCDENGNWTDVEDFDITPSTPYPLNVFECTLPSAPIYGVRWIHKNGSYKDSGNNFCFFGMKLYQ